jgi:hypothetical protein
VQKAENYFYKEEDKSKKILEWKKREEKIRKTDLVKKEYRRQFARSLL